MREGQRSSFGKYNSEYSGNKLHWKTYFVPLTWKKKYSSSQNKSKDYLQHYGLDKRRYNIQLFFFFLLLFSSK